MTTSEEIKKFVSAAEKAEKKGTLLNVEVVTKYVNKTNADDSFTSLEEAFEKGVDLAKYEKKVEKSGIKYDLENLIDKKDIDLLRRFIEVVDKLSGTISTSSSFDVNVHNIAQRLNRYYKEFDEVVVSGAKDEIIKVYEKIEENFKLKGESARVSKRLTEIREKVKDLL